MTSGERSNAALSVVIPVFNESDGIAPTIESVKSVLSDMETDTEIIVVDDGSTDGTGKVLEGIPGIRVISVPENRGVGAARNTGILAAKYDRIAMLDGDGTYPAEPIPEFASLLDSYHMVVGARTGKRVARNILRAIPKWFILKLACYISGKSIPDLNSGLRAFRKSSVIPFFPILPQGHSWVSTITLAMLSNGLPVKYIPIDYYKRIGKSTFHPFIDTYNYILLIIKTIMYFNPLKVFFPSGIILLLLGIIRLLYNNFRYNDIKESDVILIIASILILFQGLLADLVVARTKFNGIAEQQGKSCQ